MKVCIVHNAYGKPSGEEFVVSGQVEVLRENGHEVCLYQRSSAEIPSLWFGRTRAFFAGMYSFSSRRRFRKYLEKESPEIIHIHNLFPLISPSILPIAGEMQIPVVMTVHNYRLVCPTGLYYSHGEICTRCEGGREYNCISRNCENSIPKSVGYALRTWWSRVQRYYLDGVCRFVCLTDFQRKVLIRAGVEPSKITVIPNMASEPAEAPLSVGRSYVGFCGRVRYEKGVDLLIEVAKKEPRIPFVAAGSYEFMGDLVQTAPRNFRFAGHCDADELRSFYEKAQFVVFPSKWFEGFPLVLLEAMAHGKAVIASDIGGLSDIVEDGKTGLLVKPGDSADLYEKVSVLWSNPELCDRMGKAGRTKLRRDYSRAQFYDRLSDTYDMALGKCRG